MRKQRSRRYPSTATVHVKADRGDAASTAWEPDDRAEFPAASASASWATALLDLPSPYATHSSDRPSGFGGVANFGNPVTVMEFSVHRIHTVFKLRKSARRECGRRSPAPFAVTAETESVPSQESVPELLKRQDGRLDGLVNVELDRDGIGAYSNREGIARPSARCDASPGELVKYVQHLSLLRFPPQRAGQKGREPQMAARAHRPRTRRKLRRWGGCNGEVHTHGDDQT